MTRKGLAVVERRATRRPSYAADRRRAILIALLIHAIAILLLVFGLPLIHRAEIPEAENRIAISMVDSPEEAAPNPTPDLAAQQAAAAQAQAPVRTQQAEPQSSQALPYDPSFNPFALAPRSETRESAPTAPAALPSAPSPPSASPSGTNVDTNSSAGAATTAGPSGTGVGIGTLPGDAMGDPNVRPQYLRVQLNGYVDIFYEPKLHQFLQRLIDCGVVPVPGNNPTMTVEADVAFTRTGMVQGAVLTNGVGFLTDPIYQKAAGELMRALARPNCSYLQLSSKDYLVWRQVHLTFFQNIPTP